LQALQRVRPGVAALQRAFVLQRAIGFATRGLQRMWPRVAALQRAFMLQRVARCNGSSVLQRAAELQRAAALQRGALLGCAIMRGGVVVSAATRKAAIISDEGRSSVLAICYHNMAIELEHLREYSPTGARCPATP
jgi:hypothetical protein